MMLFALAVCPQLPPVLQDSEAINGLAGKVFGSHGLRSHTGRGRGGLGNDYYGNTVLGKNRNNHRQKHLSKQETEGHEIWEQKDNIELVTQQIGVSDDYLIIY